MLFHIKQTKKLLDIKRLDKGEGEARTLQRSLKKGWHHGLTTQLGHLPVLMAVVAFVTISQPHLPYCVVVKTNGRNYANHPGLLEGRVVQRCEK